MHSPQRSSPHHQRLLAAAVVWLCAGSFLLLTTLVPAHTSLLGWTPTLWLFASPLIVLLVLEARLPAQLLRKRPRRVHSIQGVIWH